MFFRDLFKKDKNNYQTADSVQKLMSMDDETQDATPFVSLTDGTSKVKQEHKPKPVSQATKGVYQSLTAPIKPLSKDELLACLLKNTKIGYPNDVAYQESQKPLFLDAIKAGASFDELMQAVMRDVKDKAVVEKGISGSNDLVFQRLMIIVSNETQQKHSKSFLSQLNAVRKEYWERMSLPNTSNISNTKKSSTDIISSTAIAASTNTSSATPPQDKSKSDDFDNLLTFFTTPSASTKSKISPIPGPPESVNKTTTLSNNN